MCFVFFFCFFFCFFFFFFVFFFFFFFFFFFSKGLIYNEIMSADLDKSREMKNKKKSQDYCFLRVT